MSGFNTQKVTNMDAMFYDCRSPTSIDLTMFDTRNVTNMRYLFGDCKNLEKLDLSKFNTQKLENASYMFYGCKKLTSLDISGFDTRNVTTMRDVSSMHGFGRDRFQWYSNRKSHRYGVYVCRMRQHIQPESGFF